jgi:hypothetical protein
MRLQIDDSVIRLRAPESVGIVEGLAGDVATVRFPGENNLREKCSRRDLRPLADVFSELRSRRTNVWGRLNLGGDSTFAHLVTAFGYGTRRLRQESLEKVVRQLKRAGLEVVSVTGGSGRDDRFRLNVGQVAAEDVPVSPSATAGGLPVQVELPETFWPTAFGLPPHREIAFLRALMEPRPILCILHAPDDADTAGWLPAAWEGMVSWAFRSAQQFARRFESDYSPEVQIGPASLLHTYLKTSVLDLSTPRLDNRPRCLNLITLRRDADLPIDFERLRAAWPGPVFRFDPELSGAAAGADGQLSSDVMAIIACLLLTAGCLPRADANLCPLKTLLWSAEACSQILARGAGRLGELLAERIPEHFKGSNEGSTALALKADVAAWIRRTHEEPGLEFEDHQVEDNDERDNVQHSQRVDVFVKSLGRFEVEALVGSGPVEAFYHQKVFLRLKRAESHLWLVVPNDAVLWAGPYLADIAHHMGDRGHDLLPGLDGSYLELRGRALTAEQAGEIPPQVELSRAPVGGVTRPVAEAPLRLKDVAGYDDIRTRVEDLIIWPEKNRGLIRRTSRSSGILFFGPPGCGKSRLARAIAGELEQEVRLLSPSDLRGAYVGWGQIMIREQFDWVAENDRRMLVIDELDAVARSRREGENMHSDEKASVNELLVQLDRVGRLGRLIVGTTNYMASLDEAVVRSGRFGRFVPVPPPTVDEAVAIFDYYLRGLCADDRAGQQPGVDVPAKEAVGRILTPFYAESANERRFFCGADLEEAVNRAYYRRLRQTISGLAPGADYAAVRVVITGQDLCEALKEVPRSVTAEAVGQFLEDVGRFCGKGLAEQISTAVFRDGQPALPTP